MFDIILSITIFILSLALVGRENAIDKQKEDETKHLEAQYYDPNKNPRRKRITVQSYTRYV